MGKGLDEAEREPVAECMAESTEMVMGAERRSAASVRGFVAAWSSSSRSSSREEWSGNSWCLKRNKMVGDKRTEKVSTIVFSKQTNSSQNEDEKFQHLYYKHLCENVTQEMQENHERIILFWNPKKLKKKSHYQEKNKNQNKK